MSKIPLKLSRREFLALAATGVGGGAIGATFLAFKSRSKSQPPKATRSASAENCGLQTPSIDISSRVNPLTPENTNGAIVCPVIRALKMTPAGLFIGYASERGQPAHGAISFFNGKNIERCSNPREEAPSGHVNAISIDRVNACVWVATDGNGIYQFHSESRKWIRYAGISGLPDNRVYSVTYDPTGCPLFALWEGIVQFDRTRSDIWVPRNDLLNPDPGSSKHIHELLLLSDGDVWVGTISGGLERYKNGVWTNYGKSTLGSESIRAITLHPQENRVYVGTDGGGVSVFDLESNQWLAPEQLLGKRVVSIGFDYRNRPWVATLDAGTFYKTDSGWQIVTSISSLSLAFGNENDVFGKGTAFIGTNGRGLLRSPVD